MNYKELSLQLGRQEQKTYEKYHSADMAEHIFNQANAARPDLSAYQILARLHLALPRLFTPFFTTGKRP